MVSGGAIQGGTRTKKQKNVHQDRHDEFVGVRRGTAIVSEVGKKEVKVKKRLETI